MAALLREFETLREKTVELSWCQKCWWEHDTLAFSDWILVDAWYRSRCLELPEAGEALVPCLDMVNHSSAPNAYYQQTSDNSVSLLLRPDVNLEKGSEITISYGSSKSAAEMLFSYGFIDAESTVKGLVLPLNPFSDDPLGKAKIAAFKGPPVLRVFEGEGTVRWESPFVFLMCLNEEDGLEFKVLQQTDGSRSQLRVFWQDSDVTESTDTFETLISGHALKDVFALRVVALLQDRVSQQLERLFESQHAVDLIQSLPSDSITASDRLSAISQLREVETGLLESAFELLDEQKNELLQNGNVLRYLGSMDGVHEPRAEDEEANEEEDFS